MGIFFGKNSISFQNIANPFEWLWNTQFMPWTPSKNQRCKVGLTLLMPMSHFYTSWKREGVWKWKIGMKRVTSIRKNHCITSIHSLIHSKNIADFWVPWPERQSLGHIHANTMEVTFSFLEFISACKKDQFIPSIWSWDTVNFESFDHSSQAHFWPYPSKKFSIFNLHEFARKRKNQAILSCYSGEKFDLKILQSDWSRAFWPISQELRKGWQKISK